MPYTAQGCADINDPTVCGGGHGYVCKSCTAVKDGDSCENEYLKGSSDHKFHVCFTDSPSASANSYAVSKTVSPGETQTICYDTVSNKGGAHSIVVGHPCTAEDTVQQSSYKTCGQ